MKITKLSAYNAFIAKGIKSNSFVTSRLSCLKFRVRKIDSDGIALCYRKDENNETDYQWFYPCEVDLI